jgi:hypothetical protein
MKLLTIITQIILFASGSLMIWLDYRINGPDATIVGYTGALLIAISVFLLLILSALSKIKK